MTVRIVSLDTHHALASATSHDDVSIARDVLTAEQQGLIALAGSLDENFARATSLLADISGRVVVSGMGKSGHIARKIAATFASTGTPALFVHPAEASHGDLGMVVAGDAVLALSNSGETAELADLVAHARRFGLPLIAITGNEGSALALAADVLLLLPPSPEACPMGLAPTTSTTMQLALGDALAVALLRRRGFSANDFQVFHPGGRLGARLRHVRDVMHGPERLPLAAPHTPLREALLVMTNCGFGCVGVVEAQGNDTLRAGHLVGIVTDGDLRRAIGRGDDVQSATVGQVMTRSPLSIGADALAAEALRVMNARGRPVTTLFVLDALGAPIGLLHVHDLLRAGIA
jgi:arabinose-5-phosphate isomerase